jgi:hypothetical protein
MKRTTIYLAPPLEMQLKAEALRRGQPMAELIREAVEIYLTATPVDGPPGAGAFASGRRDTAGDVDAALAATGFGGGRAAKAPPRARRRR